MEIATDSDGLYIYSDVATGTDSGLNSDNTLYLSEISYDKTINDCYSMLLSIRNCVVVLIMLIVVFECHKILKTVFKRLYK